MKSVNQLVEAVKAEHNRTDKRLESIQFEIRHEEVTMFFEYQEPEVNHSEHHFIKHNHDPERMDMETFEAVKKHIEELGITCHERRDIFM
ncbi:hypothetical protein HHH54_09395 [Staphylococcus sp. H16/1A]|uniref:Phage protein n=2 Tax=Staphylococcus canis TaxID=2724942 RepID=A0ABS0TAN3_9STAP|nr:hypothetical protein [Staphylococcus canis]